MYSSPSQEGLRWLPVEDFTIDTPTLPVTTEPVSLGSGYVTGLLGEGGMAMVYEIWNEKLGIKRAVKILKPECARKNRKLFNDEIKLSARLDHPNIIRIHSAGDWFGLPYIEMEKIDGCSLAQLIKARGAFTVDAACAIGLVISRALNYTHTYEYSTDGVAADGLLHRDMKPENVLISKKGIVRITDFGIAVPNSRSNGPTGDGTIVGSLRYIAPEQLNDETQDCRTDIFSFGCILYEMLTGFRVFPEKDFAALMTKRVQHVFDPLSSYKLDAPSALKRLVGDCLQLDPAKRPHDMAAVSAKLARILRMTSAQPAETIIRDFMADGDRTAGFIVPRPRSFMPAVTSTAAGIVGVLLVAAALLKGYARFGMAADSSAPPAADTTGALVTASVAPLPDFSRQNPERIVAAPDAEESMADSLRKIYRTNNLLTIMREEDGRGAAGTVLRLSQLLPRHQKRSVCGIVLTMRALKKTGRLTPAFFGKYQIDDAEYHLEKADLLFRDGRCEQALLAVDKAEAAPAALAGRDALHRRALLCRARIMTRQFYARPDSDVQKKALSLWGAVRQACGPAKDDAALLEAEREYRRLTRI